VEHSSLLLPHLLRKLGGSNHIPQWTKQVVALQ
jgi:hypothetical protein